MLEGKSEKYAEKNAEWENMDTAVTFHRSHLIAGFEARERGDLIFALTGTPSCRWEVVCMSGRGVRETTGSCCDAKGKFPTSCLWKLLSLGVPVPY